MLDRMFWYAIVYVDTSLQQACLLRTVPTCQEVRTVPTCQEPLSAPCLWSGPPMHWCEVLYDCGWSH